MVDSDVAEFNNKIKLNAALDDKTRAALYADLRKQVARNFSRANELCRRSVCRYCHVKGGLDEDVAFVLVADYAIVNEDMMDTETELDERVDEVTEDGENLERRSTAAEEKDSAGGKVHKKDEVVEIRQKDDLEKRAKEKEKLTKWKGKKASKEEEEEEADVDKRANNKQGTKVAAETRDTRSVVKGKDSPKAGEEMDGRKVKENKGEEKKVAKEKKDVDKKVNKLGKKITTADEVNKGSVGSKDDVLAGEVMETMEKRDGSVSVVCAGVEIYRWDPKTSLLGDAGDVDKSANQNLEFDRLSKYLERQVDRETAFVRYPVAADFAVLSPDASRLQFSVTSRLADVYTDAKGRRSNGNDRPGGKIGNGLDAANGSVSLSATASSVIFIGPYDTAVVNHGEIVRRRIAAVVDMLPADRSVYCITDVGCDVGLLCLADIFDASKYRNVAVNAHVGVDPAVSHVSCVLLQLQSDNISS